MCSTATSSAFTPTHTARTKTEDGGYASAGRSGSKASATRSGSSTGASEHVATADVWVWVLRPHTSRHASLEEHVRPQAAATSHSSHILYSSAHQARRIVNARYVEEVNWDISNGSITNAPAESDMTRTEVGSSEQWVTSPTTLEEIVIREMMNGLESRRER